MSIALPRLDARGRGDFMVSPANATALGLVDRWPDWPGARLAVVGPEGAGKSHLAAIWAADAGAAVLRAADLARADVPALAGGPLVVEDADRGLDAAGERALFHLWNACAATKAGLMLTGRGMPATWPAVVEQPDEALLSAVLVKLFADRQIAVRPALVRFVLPRMERSFAAAHALVERLDAEALARGRAVDVGLAGDLLGR